MTTAPGIVGTRAVAPEAFAIANAVPRFAARPRDRDELCEIVKAAAHDGLTIVPWGGGAALGREPAPVRYDLAIDLGALDRIVEYEPEDLTLTAECGVTLATLRATLAARGQELPLEAANSARATLGGVLATNASGARRLRFGSPRDRILGARFVLGDGTLARTGGKVVKNVAGYGIHRMLCGSRGGIAIVVDASLKLLPAPAARAAMIYEMDAAAIADAARWAEFAREEPSVLTVVSAAIAAALTGASGRQPFWVVLGLEDDAPRIAELRANVVKRLGEPHMELAGAEVEALWATLADLEESGSARLTFTASRFTPTALTPVLATPHAQRFVFHAACGRLHVFADLPDSAEVEPMLAETGFTRLDSSGAVPPPAFPPADAILGVRQRIRAELDPAGRFALGERWVRSSG